MANLEMMWEISGLFLLKKLYALYRLLLLTLRFSGSESTSNMKMRAFPKGMTEQQVEGTWDAIHSHEAEAPYPFILLLIINFMRQKYKPPSIYFNHC